MTVDRTQPLRTVRTTASQRRVAAAVLESVPEVSRGPAALIAQLAGDPLDTCPITGDIFRDPVVVIDGHTYENDAIQPVLTQVDFAQRIPQWGRLRPGSQYARYPDRLMRARIETGFERTEDGVPTHLLDPVDGELMTDPVIASDGITYDRSTFQWIHRRLGGVSSESGQAIEPLGIRHGVLRQDLGALGAPPNRRAWTTVRLRHDPMTSTVDGAARVYAAHSDIPLLTGLAGYIGTTAAASMLGIGFGPVAAVLVAGGASLGATSGAEFGGRAARRWDRAADRERDATRRNLVVAGYAAAGAALGGALAARVTSGAGQQDRGLWLGPLLAGIGTAGAIAAGLVGTGAAYAVGAARHVAATSSARRDALQARTEVRESLANRRADG